MVHKRKSCVKKSRVVSAVPGTNKVVVFCAHGCGISYTTVPHHVNKKEWHKTVRKLNAHESQRCPKNPDSQRCPRKHPRVRVSSTANPSVLAPAEQQKLLAKAKKRKAQKRARAKARSQTPKHVAESVGRKPVDVHSQPNFWGSTMSEFSQFLEAKELEDRLNEENIILHQPSLEEEIVTGVYWTEPTEIRSDIDAAQLYCDELERRLAEPDWRKNSRCRAAREFTQRIFPEFEAKLRKMRAQVDRSKFWNERPAWSANPAATDSSDSSGADRKRSRRSASPSSPDSPFGHIDSPNCLTMKGHRWGLGQEVFVFSGLDGGRRRGHVVGIGGFQGSSVLVQFYAAAECGGSLKQQLHHACGVEDGARKKGCSFDETTKISDFVVQQMPLEAKTQLQDLAGTAGPKVTRLQCDDLLSQLDSDTEGIFSELDTWPATLPPLDDVDDFTLSDNETFTNDLGGEQTSCDLLSAFATKCGANPNDSSHRIQRQFSLSDNLGALSFDLDELPAISPTPWNIAHDSVRSKCDSSSFGEADIRALFEESAQTNQSFTLATAS
eukprot:CAMPEP_0195520256 /NCGR_PEP_ID=MMETSP0794_2-20130614/16480_1 /TAXON_ID=515487 /ORGANISM="Stephanopyxis turris, Strain CCMP 815" /LENGTH=552 /DNA_ID=CAMNT_0040649575 /DNA_START=68 /DNA_END=1726 /DNA_ORIENTATION=+